MIRDGGRIVAGSGISYRVLRLPAGGTVLAGIMTGSWTLPEARGRNHFSRMIEQSVSQTGRRGGALLLAFVTAENASYRRLAAAGSALFPTFYLAAEEPPPSAEHNLPIRETRDTAPLHEAMRRNQAAQLRVSRFFYPTTADWTSQFLDRPFPTEILELGKDCWCVVDKSTTTDRLLGVFADRASGIPPFDWIAALRRRASAAGRKFFFFTASEALQGEAVRLGLNCVPGYLTALVADPEALAKAMGIPNQWKSTDSQMLAKATTPWSLGPWEVQGGDRM